MPAPADQVGRPRHPHLGPAERRRRVRAVQRHELSPDFLREQHDVLVLGAEDDPVPLKVAEVGRRGQRRRRAMARDGDIREVIPAVQRRDPRVLDAEFLHLRVGQEPCFRRFLDGSPVAAPDDPQVRDERQPHEAVRLALHHARVEHLDGVVREPVDRQALAGRPTRRGREPWTSLAGALRHPDQQDHLVARPDRTGVERAHDLEVLARRLQVGRPQQQFLEVPRQEHRGADPFSVLFLGRPGRPHSPGAIPGGQSPPYSMRNAHDRNKPFEAKPRAHAG